MTTPPSPRRAARSESSRRESSSSRPTNEGHRTRASAMAPLARLALRCLCLAQVPAQCLQQPVGDLGVVTQELLEAELRDGGDDQVRAGGDAGAPPLVVQEGHLPKVVARAELAVPAVRH